MPTALLLDVSLSMFRPIPSPEPTEIHTRSSLACVAINSILDYLSVHAKLEYVALVTFSSAHEVAVPFTRDYDLIRNKLPQIEEGDKTCLDLALLGLNQLILNEWGYQIPVQIILLTDGSIGAGPVGRARLIQSLPLPPPYPARLHVIPIASAQETSLHHAMPMYQKAVDLASSAPCPATPVTRGLIYCPDQLSPSGLAATGVKLCEQQYVQAWCSLRCGHLEARVQLYPPPPPPRPATLQVIGFITTHDLGTPITASKHLIIPQPQVGQNSGARDSYEQKNNKEACPDGVAEEENDPSKIPNFCVLLHGALKVSGMAALVSLGGERYGAVSAWMDSVRARRSCLLLAALASGDPAPWLGPLDRLAPNSQPDAPQFPIRATRSYSGGGGGGGWSRPHALLADVQKVLRHARKLPEKTQHLYKELNRLRRAAIALGFSELLTCVSGALERECATLPPGASQECSLQLAHAASALRDPRTALDVSHTVQPLGHAFTVTH